MCRCNKGIIVVMVILVSILFLMTGCSKEDVAVSAAPTKAAETEKPTQAPSPSPTIKPTEAPTPTPTVKPTEAPTPTPTLKPTSTPTPKPTNTPNVQTSSQTAEPVSEPERGIFDPWYKAETSISYSSGTDSDWSYGNQRKEFAVEKPCYVRIASSIVASWHWGWRYGNGESVTITYRFTGAENCGIEVSDGFLTSVPSDDPNVMVFTRTITAKKAHEEDIVVFRYDPTQVGSMSLEVIYDDRVEAQYDQRNTVYFIEESW